MNRNQKQSQQAGNTKKLHGRSVTDTPSSDTSASPDEPVKNESLAAPETDRLPVFWPAMATSIGLWLSVAPVGWFWLAWIAPAPLIYLAARPSLAGNRDDGSPVSTRRAYWMIFLAGLFYWLSTFYFIPIPHPALWGGWLAVSLYMAVYTPVFVGACRILKHQFHVPLILAAPISWTGVEWIRCHFASGMGMVCLSHSQFETPILIQVADLSGAYTLTFLMICFATGLMLTVYRFKLNRAAIAEYRLMQILAPAVVSVLAVGATLGYGWVRLSDFGSQSSGASETLRVALIQTSFDVDLEGLTDKEVESRIEETTTLTKNALTKAPDLDLIVWPEGGLHAPFFDVLPDSSGRRVPESTQQIQAYWRMATTLDRPVPVPLLVGALSYDPQTQAKFNSAVLIDNRGIITDRYYKRHLVMFGEYVPLADDVPLIESLSPMGKNMSVGESYRSFDVNGFHVVPSICFETTVPHLIREQINSLESGSDSVEVDVMINLTNDGWFYGTSCLDMHLACNVFRAVENRKPHLICANTGFSANIDAAGRMLQRGPRREPKFIICEIEKKKTSSLYRMIGALIPSLFGYLVIGLISFGFVNWFRADKMA